MTPKSSPVRWRTLGEVARWGSGGTPKRTDARYFGGDIPWVVIGDLNDNVVTGGATTITQLGLISSSAKWIEPGSVLVAMYGSIGKLGIAGGRLTSNQAIAFASPHDGMSSRYLFWYLRAIRKKLQAAGKGGTQQNISQTVLKQIPIPVPNLAEQEKIVDRVEQQMTRLDSGVAYLRRSAASLRRLRFVLFDLAAGGGYGDASDRHGKDQWARLALGDVAEPSHNAFVDGPFGSNLKTGHYVSQGPRVIRLQNIGHGEFIEAPAHITDEHFRRLDRHHADAGDVVIAALDNRPPRACLVPEWLGPAVVKADCFRLRVNKAVVHPRFLVYALNASPTKDLASSVVHGVGRRRLTLSDARRLVITLPPPQEQARIVERTERMESVRAALESTVEAAIRQAERLRERALSVLLPGVEMSVAAGE